jgi:hypothetical protein
MPTQLNVLITTGQGSGASNVTVVVPISAGLQTLDSGNSSNQGQVATLNQTTGLWTGGQTGFSSVDVAVRNMFRAGGFTDGKGNWYASGVIQQITSS